LGELGESAAAAPFPTTHWSVLVAARSADPAERSRSHDVMLAAYWRPAYKHVRLAWRKSPEDAQDLTQSFLARVLESEMLGQYDPTKARFRTFFKLCLDRFVSNEEKAARRAKRGGGARPLSLDFGSADAELARLEPVAPDRLDELFEREWVRSIFTLAVEALEREYTEGGKATAFRAFARYDLDDADPKRTYGEIAGELGVPASTVTNWLHSARADFRRLALDKLRELTGSDDEFRGEARALFGENPKGPSGRR